MLLVVAATVPGFVLALYGAADARRRDRLDVEQNAYRLARIAATAHERTIDSAHQLLLALTQVPVVAGGPDDRCSETLRAILAESPRFLTLGRGDAQGQVLCSAATDGRRDVHASQWFQSALQGNAFVIGSFDREIRRGKAGLMVAQGFAMGANRGVVFAALDPTWLSGLGTAAPLPAGTSINLIDDDGVIVSRYPDHAAWVGRLVRAAPIVQLALTQRDGSGEAAGLDGVRRLFGFHRLEGTGDTALVLTVGIPIDAAFAPANRRLYRNLLFLSVSAIIALLVTWFGSQHLILRKIDRLVRAARRMGTGDLSARAGLAPSNDEVSELAEAFDTMAWNLQSREGDARQAAESLRALASRIETIREQERTDIAREIHDELGQNLTALRMDVDWLTRAIGDGEGNAAFQRKLTSMADLLDATVPLVRRISRRLRPGVLDAMGLRAAVEWQLEEFEQRTGTATEFIGDLDDSKLGPDRATVLFRILQEALTNVIRHAGARSVTVHLVQDAAAALLEVMDDGRGISDDSISDPRALGLLGMRERASAVGGRVTIKGKHNGGTTVSVWMPLEPGDEHAST